MAFDQNMGGHSSLIPLVPASVRTATVTGTAVDVTQYIGEIAILLDSGAGGAGATLDVAIQDCDTVGGSYTALSPAFAFTQVGNAAAAQVKVLNLDALAVRAFIKAVGTIAGTASFAMSVNALGTKQNV